MTPQEDSSFLDPRLLAPNTARYRPQDPGVWLDPHVRGGNEWVLGMDMGGVRDQGVEMGRFRLGICKVGGVGSNHAP